MKKTWMEKLTEFADKNPVCFIIGVSVIGDIFAETLKFILNLVSRGPKCVDEDDD